jgi:hypothetical protein
MTNKDGTGQQFELIKAVLEPLGHTVNIKVYPYKRALYLVEEGDADMMVGMLPFKTDKLIFSQYPHDADNVVAVFPKSNNDSLEGIESMSNKKIDVISGSGLESHLGIIPYKKTEVKNRVQGLKKMLAGRSDYMIDCECGFLLAEVVPFRDQFDTKKIAFLEIFAAFTNNEHGQELKSIWDSAFPVFIKAGKAEPFYKKWNIMREYRIIKKYMDEK